MSAKSLISDHFETKRIEPDRALSVLRETSADRLFRDGFRMHGRARPEERRPERVSQSFEANEARAGVPIYASGAGHRRSRAGTPSRARATKEGAPISLAPIERKRRMIPCRSGSMARSERATRTSSCCEQSWQ